MSDGETKVTYLTASAWELEDKKVDISNEQNQGIIFGSHGPVPKACFEDTDTLKKVDMIVIFDESHIEYILGKENIGDDIYLLTGEGAYGIRFFSP